MTDIHFYHNAHDKAEAGCRLAVKAFRAGRRVALRVPAAGDAHRMDQMLWTFEHLAFVPHVMSDSPLAAETPIQIGLEPAEWPHRDVLINLCADAPANAADFAMIVEVVGTEEADRMPARNRWRVYQQAGHSLSAHGLDRGGEQ